MQQGSETLNLKQVLGVLRRRVPLIVLCAVVVAGAAFAFSKHQTKKYTAIATLAFSNNPLSEQVAGLTTGNNGNLLVQQANNLELVKLGDMAAKTASLLGHGLTEQKVSASLSIAGAGESSIVSVSAAATSPTLAAKIANTYTNQFVTEQQGANHQYFTSALALVNKQLAAIPAQQRFGAAAVALQNRAQTLRLLDELQYGNVRVAQEAPVPTSPSSPKTSSNTVVGGLLGLLLGLGLAFVLERLDRDRRVREPEDLEAIYRLPLLGSVPESSVLAHAVGRHRDERMALPADETEAFNLIRAHLRFFNVDRDLCTVVVASAAPSDGKTTVARYLAGAAARMGTRVLLLEADLRHPTVAQELDIQPGPGLPDVLIGAVSLDQATQSITLGTQSGEGTQARTLDVLTAGASPPPNPGELIESQAMESLLDQAKALYDLVVIDTPPLTVVSDAFPLLGKVDGVVIVGWVGRTQRDVAERLHQILDSSSPPLLGVIANGVKSSGQSFSAYVSDKAGGGRVDPSADRVVVSDAPVPTTKA